MWGWADCANAINPLNACPASGSTTSLAAWPGIITGGPGSGNSVTNYRSEPVPFRVAGSASPNSQPNADLSQAYRSIERQDAQLNRQPYGPIGVDAISPAKDSSVPGRTQTATPASSDAANPRVPVPKSRVVSLSPTFAGRDLTCCRL